LAESAKDTQRDTVSEKDMKQEREREREKHETEREREKEKRDRARVLTAIVADFAGVCFNFPILSTGCCVFSCVLFFLFGMYLCLILSIG